MTTTNEPHDALGNDQQRAPMNAGQIGELLSDLSFGFAILEDRRRPGAYRNGARIIKKLGGQLPAALESGELLAMKGIGKGIVGIVKAALAGDEIAVQNELFAKLPAGLIDARRIRGLGPGRARTLWQTLGLTSLGEIEYACHENRLVELPGFSAATQTAILAAIAELRDREGRLRVDQAWEFAASALDRLYSAGALRAQVVGQLARACETITELEVAVLWPVDGAIRAVNADVEKLGVTLHQADSPDSFGALVAWTTAAAQHRDQLRDHAEKMGFSLTESGLFRDGALVVTATDDAVYAALGLHAPALERREADVPLRALSEPAEELIERSDLRGALHNHTTASDGIHTLEQMRDAAAEMGLSYLGISDHSVTAAYAGGLSAERLGEQHAAIAALNAQGHSCTLLTGVESDILRDGALDYPDELLDGLDVVVASVHNRFGQGHDAMTNRMVAAGRHKHGDIIGHPTGRLLLGRPAAELDIDAFLDACAESNTAVELNANPHRFDLSVQHLRMARKRGLKVSIAADAHSADGLHHLDHGVRLARRAGLTADDVLNCLELDELAKWIGARRQ